MTGVTIQSKSPKPVRRLPLVLAIALREIRAGGNGFAVEFVAYRLLCDARILSIFEGAAEIQAQVIARRLLD